VTQTPVTAPGRSSSQSSAGADARFFERSASWFAERHLAGFGNNLCCAVMPNAALRWLLECVGRDHHLANVTALSTLKGVGVETQTCRHNAREQHVSTALCANWTLDERGDVVGQETGFLHDASLNEAGAQHSLSPIMPVNLVGDGNSSGF
jgi:hypothetical protein